MNVINAILITLLAWPIVGFVIMVGYMAFKYVTIVTRNKIGVEDLTAMLIAETDNKDNETIKIIDSKLLTVAVKNGEDPKTEREKDSNTFKLIMLWPITLLILRRICVKVESRVREQ